MSVSVVLLFPHPSPSPTPGEGRERCSVVTQCSGDDYDGNPSTISVRHNRYQPGITGRMGGVRAESRGSRVFHVSMQLWIARSRWHQPRAPAVAGQVYERAGSTAQATCRATRYYHSPAWAQIIIRAIDLELGAALEDHQHHIQFGVDMCRDAIPCGQAQKIDVQLLAVRAPDRPVVVGLAQCGGDIDDVLWR